MYSLTLKKKKKALDLPFFFFFCLVFFTSLFLLFVEIHQKEIKKRKIKLETLINVLEFYICKDMAFQNSLLFVQPDPTQEKPLPTRPRAQEKRRINPKILNKIHHTSYAASLKTSEPQDQTSSCPSFKKSLGAKRAVGRGA